MFRRTSLHVRFSDELFRQAEMVAERKGYRTLEKYITEAVRRDIDTYMVENADPLLPTATALQHAQDADELSNRMSGSLEASSSPRPMQPAHRNGFLKLLAGYDPDDSDDVLEAKRLRPVLVQK